MVIMGCELTSKKKEQNYADKYNRPSDFITSSEGKTLGKAMWVEVVHVLEEKIPRVQDVVASLSEQRVL